MNKLIADAVVALLIASVLAWAVCSLAASDADPFRWGGHWRFMLEVFAAIGFVAAFLSRRAGQPRRLGR